MTKKEAFITEIEKGLKTFELSEDAMTYFLALKNSGDKDKPAFTENGRLVLQYMQENKENYSNIFTAKEIGGGLNVSSKTASGAMRKLVNDGYIEKIGENPVTYSITAKGIEADLTVQDTKQ